MPATTTQRDPKDTFRAAYRMTRLAFRGRRHGLQLDLQTPADFTPSCRRCNIGREVIQKVAAVVGYSDNLTLCVYGQAVRIALGETQPRQRGMPRPLDFAGWTEWREWAASIRKAA